MINRIFFALYNGWRMHEQLYNVLLYNRLASCLEFDCQYYQKQGIKILILDFDGVLGPHGATVVSSHLINWLIKCQQYFKVYILSNKPLRVRQEYFKDNFPDIIFWNSKLKKPYPDGIIEIIKITNSKPQEVLIIDDRILTGILAATLAKIPSKIITKPIINWSGNFLKEGFFALLRVTEKWLIKIISMD